MPCRWNLYSNYCELSCCEHGATGIVLIRYFHFLRVYSHCGLAGLFGKHILVLWGVSILVSTLGVPVCIPINSVSSSLFSELHQYLLFLSFLIVTVLYGIK